MLLNECCVLRSLFSDAREMVTSIVTSGFRILFPQFCFVHSALCQTASPVDANDRRRPRKKNDGCARIFRCKEGCRRRNRNVLDHCGDDNVTFRRGLILRCLSGLNIVDVDRISAGRLYLHIGLVRSLVCNAELRVRFVGT